MPKLKSEIKKISLKNGVYLGAILGLITFVSYLINWDIILSPWFQFAKFLIIVPLGIYSCILARRIYFKDFNFRDGFSAFFITIVVGVGIFTLVNWILFDFIAPEAGKYINDTAIELLRERMEAMGTEADKIEAQTEALRESYQFSFVEQFGGYVWNLLIYCLIAIPVALIFKTKKPIIR